MRLVFNCRLIITDSGGIQEETTYLGIPCLTLRPNTERPITVTHGTNQLCNAHELETKVEVILNVYNKEARKNQILGWHHHLQYRPAPERALKWQIMT